MTQQQLTLAEPVNQLSLYRIETELAELGTLLGEATARLEEVDLSDEMRAEAQAEVEACEVEIRAYLTAEKAKVDSVAGFIRYLESSAVRVKAEEDRLYGYRKRLEALKDRIKDAALYVLQATDQKRLEGQYSRIRRQANPVSVEVTDRLAVPASYQKIGIRMTLSDWMAALEALPWLAGKFSYDGEATLDVAAIKSVLLKAEQATANAPDTLAEGILSTIQAVPGARLNRSKEHLRVE